MARLTNETRYVSVLVDVSARRTDREFHYRVPDRLLGRVEPGHRVRVPFGPRLLPGLVLSGLDQPEVADVKDIIDILDEHPVVSPDLISLAAWVADRYLCPRARAMRPCFPAGLRRGAPAPSGPEVLSVSAQKDLESQLEALSGRAPAQYRALTHLRDAPRPLTRAQLSRQADVSQGPIRALIDGGFIHCQRREPDLEEPKDPPRVTPPPLTPEQAQIVPVLEKALESPQPGGWLLHGVTGSGKTEVYLRLIATALQRGRGAIVLVPEIGLTPQTVGWFRGRLGSGVAVLHSGLRDRERFREWERVRSGQAAVVVGARSAVFAPVSRLGVLVLDEEHDRSYKQDETPHYHAREVARERARREGAVLVLGSATPSVETYHRAMIGDLGYLRMADRVGGRALPAPELVDMRAELAGGNRSMFSRALEDALVGVASRGEQAVLFLNRRGYSSFVLCRSCGHVIKCPHCAVSMTLHMTSPGLVCHYCQHRVKVPQKCPSCGGPHIRGFGTGTEKVAAAVESLLPGVRVLRMDTDTTSRPGSHQEIYTAFRRGEADILVGTQMVAKGWDVPGVTVVGVISADISLNLPDFRTGERSYHVLTQVSGRAGRGDLDARVIIQTYNPDHPAVRAVIVGDEEKFYQMEMDTRRQLDLPPFASLARILIRGADRDQVGRVAGEIAQEVRSAGPDITLMGPGPAPFERLRGKYRWHLGLKSATRTALMACLTALPLDRLGDRQVAVSVDVDPESML